MFCISWDEFLECAYKIINISDRICDDWNLEGNPKIHGGAYLRQIKYLPDKRTVDKYLRWEYHICYSINYAVPVLYFNVCDSAGSTLLLSDVWEYCKELYDQDIKDMYSALTQQEHPILLRPFFTIHPCKTHEFLEPKCNNIVVKCITSLGAIVGITMDYAYGLNAE